MSYTLRIVKSFDGIRVERHARPDIPPLLTRDNLKDKTTEIINELNDWNKHPTFLYTIPVRLTENHVEYLKREIESHLGLGRSKRNTRKKRVKKRVKKTQAR